MSIFYFGKPIIRIPFRINLSVFFAWYDAWVGFYYDREKEVLYFCPLPMVVFQLDRKYNASEFVDILLAIKKEAKEAGNDFDDDELLRLLRDRKKSDSAEDECVRSASETD